jgi:nucleoside-diphosphate-sugar epimerase
MRTISKGRFLFFGKGQNMRHPVYISDAVKGMELCGCAEGVDGEVFIVAGEDAVQVSKLVEVLSSELGVRSPKLHLPIALGLMAGYSLETAFKLIRKGPPFSRRSLDFFLKHNAYDIQKAKRILGYQPQIDLRTGIQNTIQWNHTNKKE